MNQQELLDEITMLKTRLNTLEIYVAARKQQQLSYPVDNSSRISLGIGIFAKDTATVATGSFIVNSNRGPVKILHA